MNENIKKLIELHKENPCLEILPATYYEVSCGDWGYWLGKIEEVKKDFIYYGDENWTTGYNNIIEKLVEKLEDDPVMEKLSDEDFEKEISEEFDILLGTGKIKEAIIIYIGLPE